MGSSRFASYPQPRNALIDPTSLPAILAVLWQRIFGSILVSLPLAVILLGLIAGIVSALVNFMTIRASVRGQM